MISCDLIRTGVSDQPAASIFTLDLDMVVRTLANQRVVYPIMDHLHPPPSLLVSGERDIEISHVTLASSGAK